MELLRTSVQEVPVLVRANLGNTTLSIEEFLCIKLGDVIPLPTRTKEEVPVYVGSRLTFYGLPGIVRNRLSVQITRRL